VLRERRASGKVVLTVVVGEDELLEIARAGCSEAASTGSQGPGSGRHSVSERHGLGLILRPAHRL
jgi:hypothetical protein